MSPNTAELRTRMGSTCGTTMFLDTLTAPIRPVHWRSSANAGESRRSREHYSPEDDGRANGCGGLTNHADLQ
jgi:hypothetical protein